MNETTDQSQNADQLDTFLSYVKLLGYFFAVITAGALFVYIVRFGGNELGSTDQFGQFGDYIGGLLNPSLSFITILLLVWSIRVQMSELAATREELAASKEELKKSSLALEASKTAHQENVDLQRRENIRKQIDDDFRQRLSRINNLLNRPIFPIFTAINNQPGYNLKSFNEVYTETRASADSDSNLFLNRHIQQLMLPAETKEKISDTEATIASYLEYICNCVVELYNYLDNKYVVESIRIQALEVFEKCAFLKIIETQEMDNYIERLQIPLT